MIFPGRSYHWLMKVQPLMPRRLVATQVAKAARQLREKKTDGGGVPEVILIGTGSEVAICVDVYEKLATEGVRARVVSMPSWELFEQQDEDYRAAVLPPAVTRRVAVEQASVLGWDRYTGSQGTIIGMKTFGASAPLKDLLNKFGFTPEHVYAAAKQQLARKE